MVGVRGLALFGKVCLEFSTLFPLTWQQIWIYLFSPTFGQSTQFYEMTVERKFLRIFHLSSQIAHTVKSISAELRFDLLLSEGLKKKFKFMLSSFFFFFL